MYFAVMDSHRPISIVNFNTKHYTLVYGFYCYLGLVRVKHKITRTIKQLGRSIGLLRAHRCTLKGCHLSEDIPCDLETGGLTDSSA